MEDKLTKPLHHQYLENITRLEIIDSNGRVYGKFDLNGITLSLQDDQRTLKLFIESEPSSQ